MSDVVGTAYVRIKALTNDIAKEIRKSYEKGLKDANLDKAAEKQGESSGKAFGDEFSDNANETISKKSKDIIPTDDLLADVKKKFQQLNFDDALNGIQENFEQLSFDLPEVDLAVDMDIEPVEDAFESIRSNHRRTADDIDRGPLNKALDKLQSKLKNLGDTSLPSIGRLGATLGLVGGAIVAALPYIQDVGSAVLAYATGLVAQVGFLGTALGGVGVAAAAAIGASLAAAIPIMLAFKSETEQLTLFKDSMAAAGEEFLRIGTATQQTLLPALDDAVFRLGELVPIFSEFGLFVGRAIGFYANFATEILVGNVAQERFQTILQSSLRILDILLPTIINFGDILSGLWVAATPAAERFAGAIGTMVQRWRDMINEGLVTGTLTETLNTWYERAEILGSALGNVAGALFDILSIGADESSSVFVRFDEWAQRFRDFTESEVGQNKIALIFKNALSVMREVNAVAADLFDGIFGRLGDVGGVDSMVEALQRFREILPEIQELWAQAYDSIKRVVEVFASNVWDKMTQAWDQMAEPLGRLVEQFLDFVAVLNDSGAFDIFLNLMEMLTNTLATLLAIPGFGTFVGYLLAFGTATKIASIALGPFISLFGKFSSLIITLIRGGAGMQMAGLAGSLQKLATGYKAVNAAGGAASMADGFKAASGGLGKFSGGLAGIGGMLAAGGPVTLGIGLAAGALVGIGAAFYASEQRTQRWEQEVRQATEAVGLLNDGLNITAEGVARYVEETSRFESSNQIDDLGRLGFTVEDLGKKVADGAISYTMFADAALASNEIYAAAEGGRQKTTASLDREYKSLAALGKAYDLTRGQLTELAIGNEVYAKGTTLTLAGNDDLLESFEELYKALGQSAKDNIAGFAANDTNIELLGAKNVAALKSQIDAISEDNAADAVPLMIKAQEDLGDAARVAGAKITGLSQATRDQIREQSRLSDGSVDMVKQYELLRDELAKQNAVIRENLTLFASNEFAEQFGEAKQAVLDFGDVLNFTDLTVGLPMTDDLDVLADKFPQIGEAALTLFDQLQGLPEAEFNAAAEALGADADTLRDAMNGAQQAIIDLQEQAVASLPTIGSLLDEATGVKEDGTQYFDSDGFVKGVNDRISDAKSFGDNIQKIFASEGAEAARLAIQQGPKAAQGLADMVAANPKQLQEVLGKMEVAEQQLQTQIRDIMGPSIATQFAQSAGLIGTDFGTGIGRGINSPQTLSAIAEGGQATMDALAQGMQGEFAWVGGMLKFFHTGTFRTTQQTYAQGRKRGPGPSLFSDGGFVGTSGIFNRSFGTDTIPAMLTPGEFVLRRAVAQAIPPTVLNSLNAGDTGLIKMLSSFNQSRPNGYPQAATASVGASPAPAAAAVGAGITVQQMTVVAPSPLEAARQTTTRLGILQTQLTRR